MNPSMPSDAPQSRPSRRPRPAFLNVALGLSFVLEAWFLLMAWATYRSELYPMMGWLPPSGTTAPPELHLPWTGRFVLWSFMALAAWVDPRVCRRHFVSTDWLSAVDASQVHVEPHPWLLWAQRGALVVALASTAGMTLMGALALGLSKLGVWLFLLQCAAWLTAIASSALVLEWVGAERAAGVAPAMEASKADKAEDRPARAQAERPRRALPSSSASAPAPMFRAERCVGCGALLAQPRCPECAREFEVREYRLRRVLAKRPQGGTWLGEDAAGRPVVVKELRFAEAESAAQVDAFAREAMLLAKLSDPRIPHLLASFREGEGRSLRFCLVQEYFDGQPLSALVDRRGPLPEALTVDVVRQVLQVLAPLHCRPTPILHRDIKPANLLRSAGGTVAVVDFGGARELEGPYRDGTLIGTVGYVPPEQLAGRASASADVYAVGVTAIHLLTGVHPRDVLQPDASLAFPRMKVSPRFAAWLRKATEKRPSQRFRDAGAALEALTRRSTPWRQALGASAVAVALVGSWAGWRHAAKARPGLPAPEVRQAASASAPLRPAPEGDERIIAEWSGGKVTAGEVRAELDHAAPYIRDAYANWRIDLVEAVARLRQMDAVAQRSHQPGADAYQRVRNLLGPVGTSEDELTAHRRRYEQLTQQLEKARIVDQPALGALRPSHLADVFRDGGSPVLRTAPFALSLDSRVSLIRGTVFAGGYFLFDDGDLPRDPLDWLYIDLAWDGPHRFSGGVWIPYEPPEITVSASTANTWKLMPPGAPEGDGVLARYRVKVGFAVHPPGAEKEALDFILIAARPLQLCVARTAWDQRWREGKVSFRMQIKDGLVQVDPKADVEISSSIPRYEIGGLAFLHRVENCGTTLARWRFPRRVDASLECWAKFSGTPWSDEEQRLNVAP